jgi:diguanylate cyclase (GGDEF)-like protein
MDTAGPIELAPRVWWVGSLLPGDDFQCHVYLIEQGDQSVLIDPGSALTTDEVIRKINAVVGLRNVRWLVCSHCDPDIIGALPAMTAAGLHPEATIVTHWRDEALMRHAGSELPYWRVEEHDWQLHLVDRTLRFVFTPYAHFAGAFNTFDEVSGTLFSSDLFGGFGAEGELFAASLDYFDGVRAFHEHYMPSREILVHAIDQLRTLPIQRIAPQHGKVVCGELVTPLMDMLAGLECGIYLLAREDPGLRFLLATNQIIHEVIDTLVHEKDFAVVASRLDELARGQLGAASLELWTHVGPTMLQFDGADHFVGRPGNPPGAVVRAFEGFPPRPGDRLTVAMRSPTSGQIGGVAVLSFDHPITLDEPTSRIVDQIGSLVEAGLEREVVRRTVELDRLHFYEQATHDALTGLYNRNYLADALRRLCAVDDGQGGSRVAALMIDVDHFKRVNDTLGHQMGDKVLAAVAAAIMRAIRPDDVAVRFGGEEFVVVLADIDVYSAKAIAERIRASIAQTSSGLPDVTASVGVALRSPGESCDSLVGRADEALYCAKEGGRDRVAVAVASAVGASV